MFSGRIAVARSLAAEAEAVVAATGSQLALRTAITLANWRGQDAEAEALTEARREDVLQRGEGLWLQGHDWGSPIRYNGLGRYDDALAAAERAVTDPHGLGLPIWALSELIEAAVRAGKPEPCRRSARQLAEISEGQRNGLGTGQPTRAAQHCWPRERLQTPLYREALERLSRASIPADARRRPARTSVYGEWLRREGRRVDAREQLRLAHEAVHRDGHGGFRRASPSRARRHRRDVRKRTAETLDDLTPQELEIAQRAAGGQTNPEIGGQLFLSPRTVEWHLHKVFGKLGISSRKELRSALLDAGAAVLA